MQPKNNLVNVLYWGGGEGDGGGGVEAYTLEFTVIGVLFDLFQQRAPTPYTLRKCYLFL